MNHNDDDGDDGMNSDDDAEEEEREAAGDDTDEEVIDEVSAPAPAPGRKSLSGSRCWRVWRWLPSCYFSLSFCPGPGSPENKKRYK